MYSLHIVHKVTYSSEMKTEPITGCRGKGHDFSNKLSPQCGAYRINLLDGNKFPGLGPCLHMTSALLHIRGAC